jgi:hypothetical protein
MEKLDATKRVAIPMSMLPIFRTQVAIDSGVEKNLLFKTWGGIGDQICAEPTLRYALRMFKDCKISLASEIPELFGHLEFDNVFDLKKVTPNYKNFLCFETITPPDDSNLVWQFFSHMLVNCVDFPSMCALRQQLAVADKQIVLKPKTPESFLATIAINGVVLHPGKHWQSKTFPKIFWDKIIRGLKESGTTPILIGADTDDNRGTVDVDATGCVDLRNKLSIMESVWVCQAAKVLITNDSSPMHMAASGNAWIAYLATCKHPDMITHWRNGQWQWREKNFSKGGIWNLIDYCPNKEQELKAEFVPQEILESWLPEPTDVVTWTMEKLNEGN